MNGEPQTPWLSCISNASIFSLKLLLSAGRNISSKERLCDLFYNEDFDISSVIFHSQPWVEHHTLGKKRTVIQNNFTLHRTNIFFFKYFTLYICKINSFLNLKQNKMLLDNKHWESLNAIVSCMDQWLWGYI